MIDVVLYCNSETSVRQTELVFHSYCYDTEMATYRGDKIPLCYATVSTTSLRQPPRHSVMSSIRADYANSPIGARR